MDRQSFKVEICAGTIGSCAAAQASGADRVELCAGLSEGGLTPSVGFIRRAREVLTSCGLNVIIRPRGGDFLYSESEIRQMVYDIYAAQDAGADALVFGALTAEGKVDVKAMTMLMTAAGDLPVTFHRAFDHSRDPFEAMEEIIGFGCSRILTSGCRPTAPLGSDVISQLVHKADDRIIIMPGCGVNSGNIADIATETGAVEFHFSAKRNVESQMLFTRPDVLMGNEKDGCGLSESDPDEIRAAIQALCRL